MKNMLPCLSFFPLLGYSRLIADLCWKNDRWSNKLDEAGSIGFRDWSVSRAAMIDNYDCFWIE